MSNLLVIDLEATCDEPKPPWQSEIIEIGVCVLDDKALTISHPKSFLVQPSKTPITGFCTRLTTLTADVLLKEGTTLGQALKELYKPPYELQKTSWISWGRYDLEMLKLDCADKGLELRMGQHIDISKVWAMLNGHDRKEGVQDALTRLGLHFGGTPHRGVDDAINIARIWIEVLKTFRGNG